MYDLDTDNVIKKWKYKLGFKKLLMSDMKIAYWQSQIAQLTVHPPFFVA